MPEIGVGRLEIDAVAERDFWGIDGLDEIDCVRFNVGDAGESGPFPIVVFAAWLNAV